MGQSVVDLAASGLVDRAELAPLRVRDVLDRHRKFREVAVSVDDDAARQLEREAGLLRSDIYSAVRGVRRSRLAAGPDIGRPGKAENRAGENNLRLS